MLHCLPRLLSTLQPVSQKLTDMNILQHLFCKRPNTDLATLIQQGAFLVDVRTPGKQFHCNIKS